MNIICRFRIAIELAECPASAPVAEIARTENVVPDILKSIGGNDPVFEAGRSDLDAAPIWPTIGAYEAGDRQLFDLSVPKKGDLASIGGNLSTVLRLTDVQERRIQKCAACHHVETSLDATLMALTASSTCATAIRKLCNLSMIGARALALLLM